MRERFADQHTPLIQKGTQKRHLVRGISDDATTFINVLKNIVGGSVICVPWMYGILGWVPGTLLLILSAVISWYTFVLYGQVTERLQVKNINQIVLYGWGPTASKIFDLLLIMLLMCVLVYYLVCVTDWLSSVTRDSISRFWLLTGIVWLIFFPSTIIPNLRTARVSSFLGSIALSILILGVCGQSFVSPSHPPVPAFNYSPQWPSMFNVALPAFAGHVNAPALYAESISRENWTKTVSGVYIVVLSFTTLFAFAAYFQFGSALQSNVLNNFPETSFVTNAIRIVMVLNLLCTAPLLLFAFRETIDTYVQNLIPVSGLQRRLSIGFCLCFIAWIWAHYIPFLGFITVIFMPIPMITTTFVVPIATSLRYDKTTTVMGIITRWFVFSVTCISGLVGFFLAVQKYGT